MKHRMKIGHATKDRRPADCSAAASVCGAAAKPRDYFLVGA
jgi:hypothetical protein